MANKKIVAESGIAQKSTNEKKRFRENGHYCSIRV
jgi:hypothetical protein